MSFLYIIVGIKHFVDVEYFVSIVPNYISWKKEAVFISGFFEILLGILLLFHKTRKISSMGNYNAINCCISCQYIFICI